MSLKTKVKVGNITNLSDARYCAGMGVDLLGFPFSAEEFEKNVKTFKEITGWISGPVFVLEADGKQTADQFTESGILTNDVLLQISLSSLKLFSTGDYNLIVKLNSENLGYFKSIPAAYFGRIKYVILSGIEVSDLRSAVEKLGLDTPILVETDVTPANIEEMLDLPIAGIALNGSAEERPGVKEYEVADILEALEEN